VANHLTTPPSVLSYVAHLPPRAHAIFCYEDVESAREVLVSYINGGRERNEAICVLGSSRESYDHFLQSTGLSAQFAEHPIDFLEMNKFASAKGIEFETALTLAKSRLEDAKRTGSSGLRVFILANDYLDYTTAEGVLQFEKRLGQNFAFPLTAVCAYDLTEVGGRWDQILLELLKVHGAHIFKGLAGSERDVVS